MPNHSNIHEDFAFYQDMFNALPLALSCWSKEGEPICCSKSFLSFFGVQSIEEYLQTWRNFTPVSQPGGEDSASLGRSYLAQAFEKGECKFLWTHITKDGDPFLVEYSLTRISQAGEDIVVSFFNDLQHAYSNLYEEKKRAQAMLDAAPLSITLWNKNNEVVDCNQETLNLYQFATKQEYKKHALALYPEYQPNGKKSKDLAKNLLQTAFEKGQCHTEWEFLTLNGEKIQTEATLTRIKYDNEDVVIEYIKDLRKIKASEIKAKEAEERARVMLDTTPLCANFWNKNFENIDCNLEAPKLFELKDKQEYLDNFFDLSPEYQPNGRPSSELALEKITTAFADGYCRFEWLHQKLNGEPMPCEITLIRQEYHSDHIVIGYTRDLREIKLSEAKAKDAEDRARVMLDTTPLSLSFWNKHFENIDCNLEAVKLFGLEKKQDYLDRFFELSPKYQPDGQESKPLALKRLQTAFEEGYLQFEWLHQKLNGEPIPCEITLIRQEYQDDHIVIGYTKDLREIKASEAKVKETEKRAQIMLDTMPLCANFWNKNFENIDCNLEAAKLFDLNDKQEYLDRFFELSPEYQPNGSLSSELALEKITTAFRDGYCHFEWMHQKLDGEPMPCEITLIRQEYQDDHIVIGYTRDLREIKASEAKVKEAEKRAQVMLDTMPLCANFWNKNFENIDCNLEAAKLFDLNDKQEYLDRFFELSPEYQPNGRLSSELALENITTAFRDGYCHFEWMHQKLSGEPMPSEITLIRQEYQDDHIVIGYTRDLREFKTMLREIKKVEEDLRAARDTAEKSTKAKSEFLANMSHEIRTPMNGIIGLLHLLSRTELQNAQEEYVNKCLYSANNLLRIINDILDVSKIEAGKMELEHIPFTLDSICEDVKNLYGPRIQDKQLTFSIEKNADTDLTLLSDPLRLKQVLFNLVSNSLKFTEQGGITLSITTSKKTDDSIHCLFAVKDTGIGLSQEQIDRLFSPFSQADSSVTRKYGGTGLGLTISKNIVDMLGGTMWLESKIGMGSAFFFECTFPITTKKVAPTYEESGQAMTHSGHILLVEDNDINQLIAVELLQTVGYTVDIAYNGEEALTLLQQKPYDLVLMDIQMPIMDGLTATQKIREMEQFKNLPVIAMSAHAMEGDKEVSIAHGMNDHITKPIDPNALYASMHHWLNLARKNNENE